MAKTKKFPVIDFSSPNRNMMTLDLGTGTLFVFLENGLERYLVKGHVETRWDDVWVPITVARLHLEHSTFEVKRWEDGSLFGEVMCAPGYRATFTGNETRITRKRTALSRPRTDRSRTTGTRTNRQPARLSEGQRTAGGPVV